MAEPEVRESPSVLLDDPFAPLPLGDPNGYTLEELEIEVDDDE